MTTQELREIINTFPKYPSTKLAKPASLVNDGFPSCFNLSIGEDPMYRLYGQYLDYDQNLIFTTIQPCIRHEDWKKIVDNDSEAFRYLNLFEMACIGGYTVLHNERDKQEEVAKFHMKSMVDFLKNVGFDIKKLRISYFAETPIIEATKGKYNINRNFPTDPFYKYWLELGLEEDQLASDKSRDTMLALNIFGLPSPWGYRYEILYEYNGSLWDIGTIENAMYRPVFDKQKRIIDIISFDNCIGISAVGFERIASIVNDKKFIWEIDNIYPLIEFIREKSVSKIEYDAVVLIQAFRAIHKIVSEGYIYENLGRRRKEYIRKFYHEFFDRIKKLGIEYSNSFIIELCELNAKLNLWYPELLNSKNIVSNEFSQRKDGFENDSSVKRKV